MPRFTQFNLLTEAEARELLRTIPKTADTYADRIAAQRTIEFWEAERTAPATRAAKAARRARVLPRPPAPAWRRR